jgi:hypothetical protein
VARTTRLMVSSGVVVGKLARVKMASALPLASPTENDVPLQMHAHTRPTFSPKLGQRAPNSLTNKQIYRNAQRGRFDERWKMGVVVTLHCHVPGLNACKDLLADGNVHLERKGVWLCVRRGRAWGVGWVLSDKQLSLPPPP